MKKNILIISTCLGFFFLVLHACTTDEIPPANVKFCDSTFVNYTDHIKTIIDSKCSVSGCHNGATAAGGLITESYTSMLNSLNNGTFVNRVLTIGDMPQNDTMSTTNLDLISCWVDDGFPEFAVAVIDPCPNDTITYYDTLKTLIDAKCSVSGCHDAATQAGSLSTASFADLNTSINNGTFETRSQDHHNVPTTDSLTQAELDLLLCWKFDQYAEGIAGPCSGTFTYDGGINTMLNNHCSISGCHGDGSSFGGVSTESYAGMTAALTGGSFNTRVLVQKGMPLGTDTLTTAQLDSLECWKNAGYPEN